MIIYIDRIPASGLDIKDVIPTADFDLSSIDDGSELKSDVKLDVNVVVVDEELLVKGSWEVEASFVCSRCLDAFSMHLEEKNAFFDFELEGRDSIDLTDSVREDIILHFPVKPLCKESCQGLCPYCGEVIGKEKKCDCAPPSRDPRFAALDKLKKKLEG